MPNFEDSYIGNFWQDAMKLYTRPKKAASKHKNIVGLNYQQLLARYIELIEIIDDHADDLETVNRFKAYHLRLLYNSHYKTYTKWKAAQNENIRRTLGDLLNDEASYIEPSGLHSSTNTTDEEAYTQRNV